MLTKFSNNQRSIIIDQIVNNVRLTQNLMYMLNILKKYNSIVKFSKYIIILSFLARVIVISYNYVYTL